MQQLILVLHVIFSVTLVSLILIQHGKGADAGASFGGGMSGSMFGSQGATPFLVKVTGLVAALFIVTSLTLGFMAYRQQAAAANLNAAGWQDNTPSVDANDSLIPVASDLTNPLTEKDKN
jgi:preprotein translocase subunit SecG